MTIPDGRVEAPWEASVRVAGDGFIVSWYIELTDALDTGNGPLYRLHEEVCKTMQEAIGVLTEHLGEYNIYAYNTKTHELVERTDSND